MSDIKDKLQQINVKQRELLTLMERLMRGEGHTETDSYLLSQTYTMHCSLIRSEVNRYREHLGKAELI